MLHKILVVASWVQTPVLSVSTWDSFRDIGVKLEQQRPFWKSNNMGLYCKTKIITLMYAQYNTTKLLLLFSISSPKRYRTQGLAESGSNNLEVKMMQDIAVTSEQNEDLHNWWG